MGAHALTDVFFHIGLHKTGTTFLQPALFPQLDKNCVLYNPREFYDPLRLLAHLGSKDREDALIEVRRRIQSLIDETHVKSLLLSHEGLSQLPYTQDYEGSIDLLHRLWPAGKILVFFRYQPKWFVSCYKQSVLSGDCQSIEDFLCFRDGDFQSGESRFNSRGLVQMDIRRADFAHILEVCFSLFGEDNVFPFFAERLFQETAETAARVCEIVGCGPTDLADEYFINRSLSAFSVALMHAQFRTKELILSPEKLNTIRNRSAGRVEQMLIKLAEKPMMEVVDEGDLISISRAVVRKGANRIKRKLSPKHITHLIFDKMFYLDWNQIDEDNMNAKLDEYFVPIRL